MRPTRRLCRSMRFPQLTSLIFSLSVAAAGDEIRLSALDLGSATQGWGTPTANRSVEYRILRLATRRPDHVDRKQWAACLHWTWNLHANYGPYPYFHERARDRFLAEFDRRLAGDVDLGTIDWIWDQYWPHSSGGHHYSQNYRPTTPERLKAAAEDRYGENDLGRWVTELKRRDERSSGK